MKLKPMLMFAGVMAAVAIAITPLAASAQNQPSQAPQQSEQSPQKPARIVLSREQQEKFKEMQARAIGDIEDVLTPAQKTQFATGRRDGRGLEAIENLSESQVGQIQKVLQDLNDRIGALLTDDQKQQIQQQSQSNR
jgi:flagellar basal body L-ring protein FlgH